MTRYHRVDDNRYCPTDLEAKSLERVPAWRALFLACFAAFLRPVCRWPFYHHQSYGIRRRRYPLTSFNLSGFLKTKFPPWSFLSPKYSYIGGESFHIGIWNPVHST